MPVKKKKKKIKKSSVSKQPRRGLQNLNVGFVKNPYSEAAKVKSWKELEKFISIHTPALGPAGVAYAATKFSMDNYNDGKQLKPNKTFEINFQMNFLGLSDLLLSDL